MFTGIVENFSEIIEIKSVGTNRQLWLRTDILSELKIDQSLMHNGICLTVDALLPDKYRITAIDQTIKNTSIGSWKVGQKVNIERCMPVGGRLDGHIVQGHIDTTLRCIAATELDGSHTFEFLLPKAYRNLVIERGSIALDGISLTCHSVEEESFAVSIIPYTWQHTVAQYWQVGEDVNAEFDVVGKYILRMNSDN